MFINEKKFCTQCTNKVKIYGNAKTYSSDLKFRTLVAYQNDIDKNHKLQSL